VAEDTESWLEQLEVAWAAGARVDRQRGAHSPPRPDDVTADLACVDALAAAQRFFSDRRAFKVRV
jgi:hypothetical protein